ncbi:hypothetical protein JW835_14480 [bacterium]|nr:hypothetical protein [bacterium]
MIKNKKTWMAVFLILGLLYQRVYSRGSNLSERWAFNIEIGNWQPHSLNDEPRFDTFGAAGATPFMGLGFSIPALKDLTMKLSLGFWSLRDLDEVVNIHTLVIHPLMLDFKYWLVPDALLSAYVSYGGGIFWGAENETLPFGEKLHTSQHGWGINLGAGFDVAFSAHMGLGMNFQYHYVIFKYPLGGVEDFSGPKINAGLIIYLGH